MPNNPVLDRLVVPENQRQLLERAGVVPSFDGDVRRFPRCYAVGRAELRCYQGLPAFSRPQERHAIMMIDLSRGGIGFLHSEQLFPGERAVVALAGGKEVHVEVQWCRRLGEQCYQVGGRFIGN
jgi:hypothetical protein